jgi:hypothetical protein
MSVRIFSTLIPFSLIFSGAVSAKDFCQAESQTSTELSAFMEGATKVSEVASRSSSVKDRRQLQKRIQELMTQMLTAESDLDRALAVYELKETNSPIVPHALKKALKDKSADVRLAALTSIAELEISGADEESLGRWILSKSERMSLLKTDSSSEVRQLAVWSLDVPGYRDDPNVVAALKESADKDESPEVREAAIQLLDEMGQPDPAHIKINVLDDDEYGWKAPTQDENNVFIRSTFTLEVYDRGALDSKISDVVRLYPLSEGPDAAVELTDSYPMTIDPNEFNGARFVFKPREALKPHTTYVLAPLHMPPEDVGTSKASVIFTTGDELGSTAKPHEQIYPYSVIGLPRRLNKLEPLALTKDLSGKLKMDWSAFERRMREGELHKEIGSIFFTKEVSPTQQIVMEFNDRIDSSTAKEAIRIYDSLSGRLVDTEALDIQVNEYRISVSAGANGFVPNSNYILVVGQNLKTNSGVHINGTYATAFSTGSN